MKICVICILLLLPVYVNAKPKETAVLGVVLNTQEKGDYFLILTDDGDVLFGEDEFLGLGFREIPEKARISEGYVSLRSLSPEVAFEVDERGPLLVITADPGLFERHIIDLSRKGPPGVLYLSENTAFFNYSLGYNMGDDFGFESLSLSFNLGLRRGSLLGYSNFSYKKTDTEDELVRQLTNITRDDPRTLRRYVLGDFFATSGGRIGGGSSFGGLSISKDFSMSPYFIRSPGLEVSGVLETPSEVKVYVNDILQRIEELGPGEFEFLNLPASGTGETTIVIRDAYGREKRIRTPFYISSGLLAPGIDEYSYNLGFKREEMGIESFKYGKLAFVGYHRRGLTKGFTGGLRAEADEDTVNLGPMATFVLGTFWEMDAALAASSRDGRYGCGGFLGLSFPRVMGMNARLSLRGFSKEYGDISSSQKPRSEVVLGLGLRQKVLGSIFGNYTIRDRYDEAYQKRLALYYSRSVPGNGSLSVSVHRRWEEDEVEDEAFVGVRFFIGGRTLGLNGKIEEERTTMSAELQKNPPLGIGVGYRFRIEGDRNWSIDEEIKLRGQAHLEYHGPYGIYSADYRRSSGRNNYDMRLSGAAALVDGGLYFSRPIHDGFALVRVGDVAGVKVKYNNQEVGQTNRRGEVLVPGLISYYDNRLSIVSVDLPMGYNVLDATRYVSVPYRSGGAVQFDVVKLQAVEGRLFWVEDGAMVPAEYAGLEIKVEGRTIETIIGKDGEFYLENISSGRYPARIFKGDKERCFEMVIPESDQIIVDLGDIYTEAEDRR
ncbi:MAG: fimbria/pilus outer membrane usher protein [bacterium]|nr:fimbria/pilus outer membrane usher protein [bacterium]